MTLRIRRRMLMSAGRLLVLTGLAALAWCGMALARTRVYQEQRAATLNREILFRPINALANSTLREGALLGSVSIPRLGVSSVILDPS